VAALTREDAVNHVCVWEKLRELEIRQISVFLFDQDSSSSLTSTI
jgi:hypothetical protein